MPKIHLLDKSVYELIAAGEVIERPSSVVKEMLENAIDAGATNITVEIKNGGRTYIRVTDNGCGIASEDIPTAFLRHATSKIIKKDDLSSIQTLGFRGEALASICAVARVDVITKRREDSLGTHYIIEGGDEKLTEPSGCPDGTTISVRDLFYNVPARLKFLKKDVSEGNAVANMVSKIVLSHPEISFRFIRDNRAEIVTSGDGRLLSAIYAVFGREFYESVIPVDYNYNGIKVTGYVSLPLAAKANRSFQNFFVNSRYVKSVTCMVALEEAYRNQIMTGKFPACVLRLELDPSNTDVNVHPAKIEIRFSDEKPIYDAVYFAVKNALMSIETPQEIAIEQKPLKSLTVEEITRPIQEKSAEQLTFSWHANQIINPAESSKPEASVKYESKFPSDIGSGMSSFSTLLSDAAQLKNVKFKYINPEALENRAEKEITETVSEPSKDDISALDVEVIGEAFKTYIIAQRGDDELYLIDKHAAHERYNFDRLKKHEAHVEMQVLLSPITVNVGYEAHDAVCQNLDVCERLGFGVEPFEAPNVVLTAVPVLTTDDDPADLLIRLADSLLKGKNGEGTELFDDLFHSIACKASIKANSLSAKEELEKIVDFVINEDIRYCPHGRPAILKLSKREVEKLFKRIV